MSKLGINEPEWLPLARPQAGLWQFGGYLGSLVLFRRDSQAINGQLTGILGMMSSAVKAVFGKGPL